MISEIVVTLISAFVGGMLTYWTMKATHSHLISSFEGQLQVLTSGNKQLSEEKDALTSKLAASQENIKNLEQQLGKHQAAIADRDNNHRSLIAELDGLRVSVASLETRVKEAEPMAQQYSNVKEQLIKSSVIRTYEQPVLLIGPRRVGKSSLVMQWHAPWEEFQLRPTLTHRVCKVPVISFPERELVPHFAIPDINVRQQTHLVARVHDFPGDLDTQKMICEMARSETELLRQQTKEDLGIVVVCMFPAQEAHTGLSTQTLQYYNSDMFRELRRMVSHGDIELDRLVFVFNKYDLLREHVDGTTDDKCLIRFCLDKFESCFTQLHGICNPEKVCEVFTVLSRDDMRFKNRGAPVVRGLCTGAFVRALGGDKGVADMEEKEATYHAAEKFM